MSDKQVALTIDSIAISVPEGATILKAARSAGIEIPHLCYDPDLGLPPTGSCRLCLVELEGAPNPVASCTHPVAPGMIVHTETEALRGFRRTVLELLLTDHPQDCATCEQSGECLLETYAYDFGLREKHDPLTTLVVAVSDDAPTMDHDNSKCILCGRCVLVCQNVQQAGAIDFQDRGYDTEIGLPPGLVRQDSDCELCGNCIAVCPTGAVKARRMVGLVGAKKVRTTCGYCGVGCQFDLNVRDGRVVGVTSATNSPVNGRWLCVKGRFGYEFIHHPDRLTTPLIRRNGELEPASWDEALDLVTSRLTDIKAADGPDAIGLMSSSRCTNEENYLMQVLARAVIGTNSVDQCART